jgi:hypothetical protein
MRSFRTNRVNRSRALALASLTIALAFAAPALSKTIAPKAGKPRVATGGVSHLQKTPGQLNGSLTGQLNGSVAPNGLATGYYFQYGPTNAYGSQTPTANLAAGTTNVKVSQTVTGLLPGYHYRLVASNSDGQAVGKDKVLATTKKRLQFTFPKIKGHGRVAGYRGTYTLSGTLIGLGSGNHPLALQAEPYPYKGGFTTVGSIIATNAAGGFSFVISQLIQSTRFRVEALGPHPSYSATLPIYVAVNVIIHVRAATHAGLARVYGTVAPATAGVVIIEVLKPGKETIKREASGPRGVPVGSSKLKRATTTLSRFSVVVGIPSTARYRAFVRIGKGPLVSGYSRNILIRTSVVGKSKKGKGKPKTKG